MRVFRPKPLLRAALASAAAIAALTLLTARTPTVAAEPSASEPVVRSCAVLRTADSARVLELALDGSTLMPAAKGRARLERERKTRELELRLKADRLLPPETFGAQFTTYVVWTVDGAGTLRSAGELRRRSNSEASLEAVVPETDLFGLLVTAEPHFAISAPSDAVVFTTRPDNKAARRTPWAEAECRLAARDVYRFGRTDEELALSLGSELKRPLPEMLQAMNAVEIARLSQADVYAADRIAEARTALLAAQKELGRRNDRKAAARLAREAVLAAESARRESIARSAAQRQLTDELDRVRDDLVERDERIAELERDLARVERRARRPAAPAEAPAAAPAPAAPIIVQVPPAPVPATPPAVQPDRSSAVPAPAADAEASRLAAERAELAKQRHELELARSAEEMRNQLTREIRSVLDAERSALEENRDVLQQERQRAAEQLAAVSAERHALEAEKQRAAQQLVLLLGEERARLEAERLALASGVGSASRLNTMTDVSGGTVLAAPPAPVSPPVAAAPAPVIAAPPVGASTLEAERAELARLNRELEERQRSIELERLRLEAERSRLAAERALDAAPPATPAPPTEVVIVERVQSDPEPGVSYADEPRRKRRIWPFSRRSKTEPEESWSEIDEDEPGESLQDEPRRKRRWWPFGRQKRDRSSADDASMSAEAVETVEDAPQRKRRIWPFSRKERGDADAAETDAPERFVEEPVAAEPAAPAQPASETLPTALPPAPDARLTTPGAGDPAPTPAAVEQEESRLLELRTQTELLASERARLEAERLSLERTQAAAAAVPEPAVPPAPAWRTRLSGQFDVRSTETGLVLRLGDLNFPSGSARLPSAAREELARLAGALADASGIQIVVEGHTDNTGASESNLRLSQARADSVVEFLIAKGIDPMNLSSRGFGDSRPAATNETPQGRRENRRVELVISERGDA